MICPNCHTSNLENATHCYKCGALLKPVEPTPNPVPPSPTETPKFFSSESSPMPSNDLNTNNANNINNINNNIPSQSPFPTINQVESPSQMNGLNSETSTYSNPTFSPVNTSINSTPSNPEIPKKSFLNKKMMFIIGGIVLVAAIAGGIFFFLNQKGNGGQEDEQLESAFFIPNKEGKRAIYSIDGKKVTDFIFDSVDYDFQNDVAVVEKDGKAGLVNAKGKMIVDFGTYNSIVRRGSLYSARQELKKIVLSPEGKVLYENAELKYDIYENVSVVLENNTYHIHGANGKEVYKITTQDLNIHVESNIITIVDNHKVHVIDALKEKEIISFNSDSTYRGTSNEDGIVTLVSQGVDNKIIKDGKIYTETECDYLRYDSPNFVCEIQTNMGTKTYNLTKDYKVEYESEVISYIDDKTYAVEKDGSVEFYKNGKLVNTVKSVKIASSQGKTANGMYLINENGPYYYKNFAYYDTDGKKVFNKSFEEAKSFDDNHNAQVKDDNLWYLIDEKGNKISEEYSTISRVATGQYTVRYNNYGLLDSKGQVIIPCEWDAINLESNAKDPVIVFRKSSKYLIYNLKTNKEIFQSSRSPTVYKYYIQVYNSDAKKTEFYTYDGVKFYEY